MSDTTIINSTELETAIQGTYTNEETIHWHGLDVIVKRNLSLGETLVFVKNIVEACFTNNNLTYHPEVRDFAIRIGIVSFYTNIQLPEDYTKQYEILYQTNLLPSIVGMHIDREQLNILIQAIDDRIESINQANIEQINNQINDVVKGFETFQNGIYEIYNGIDVSGLKNFIEAFEGDGISEEKIVDAVIKANGQE